jgi:ATP-dependent Clp protease ATP-binding subunit ClpA
MLLTLCDSLDMEIMFERFTDRARRVLVLAQEFARIQGHSFIGTEHILWGLTEEQEGIAAQVLADMGLTTTLIERSIKETVGQGSGMGSGAPPFTPRCKKVLELGLREALQLGHSYIATEHLLLGLVREGEGVGAHIVTKTGHSLGDVRKAVIDAMGAAEPPPSPSLPEPEYALRTDGALSYVLMVRSDPEKPWRDMATVGGSEDAKLILRKLRGDD